MSQAAYQRITESLRKYSSSYSCLAAFPTYHIVDMLEHMEQVYCNKAYVTEATPRRGFWGLDQKPVLPDAPGPHATAARKAFAGCSSSSGRRSLSGLT